MSDDAPLAAQKSRWAGCPADGRVVASCRYEVAKRALKDEALRRAKARADARARRLFRIGERIEAVDTDGRRWSGRTIWWLKGGQQSKWAWLFEEGKKFKEGKRTILVRCQ